MDLNFNDLIDILDGEEFDERPVDLQTFITSPDYLGLPPLSDYQYTLIEKSSQIYKESTLIKLFGEEEGKEYQTACTRVPIAPNARNLTRYFERLKYLMGTPSYQNTSFGQEPYVFGVYKPMASDFEQKESVAIPSVADPFASDENTTAVSNDTKANIQFSLAIFTPVPASDKPISMMTGPITTGGNKRSRNLTPCHLTSALIKK